MRNSNAARLLSLVLALILMVGVLPISVWAQETEPLQTEDATTAVTEPTVREVTEEATLETVEETASETLETSGEEQDPEYASVAEAQSAGEGETEVDPADMVTQFSDFMTYLADLERYAEAYALEHPEEDSAALIINYIRCGVSAYTSSSWTTFCGPEKTEFTKYVAQQDAANGTHASRLRNLDAFTLSNGDTVEFAHMFGAMDMSYHTGNQSTADLGSWAGDICDLVQLTTNAGVTGTVEEMAEEIRTSTDKYFLWDSPDAPHSFGRTDLYGDLDAFYILKKVAGGASVYGAMQNYFTTNLTDALRVKFFLENRFNGISAKEDIRDAVYDTYCANEGIRALEGTYLDSAADPDLRKACCYAFADYLYLTAKDQMENPYYTVFSSTSSLLAPGVTQQVKMALTSDEKQIVYYLATVDVSRSDVEICANYADNDASSWKMARLTDQMTAAEKKHANPDDAANYIPNYNAVAGVNADFYNMSNG